MVWIEAIMAFAITMMALSTMVTMIVEMIHRMLRLREKGFTLMLEQFHNKVLLPRVASHFNGDKKDLLQGEFLKTLSTSRYQGGGRLDQWLIKTVNSEKLRSLTALQFIERFAETEEGQKIFNEGKKRGKEYLDVVIKDLANKYDDIGENVRDYFTRRARLVSVVVAMLLAFAINVDSVRIFQTYLKNDVLRTSIIQKSETVKKLMDEKSKQQGDTETELNNIKATAEQIKVIYTDIAKEKDLHIGWEQSILLGKNWEDDTPWFQWFLSLLLGGLLIGLGGPFWFDIFQKFSAFASIAQSFQSSVKKPKEEGTQSAGAGEIFKETDPVEIFKTAAKAKAFTEEEVLPPRPLLDTNGNVIGGS